MKKPNKQFAKALGLLEQGQLSIARNRFREMLTANPKDADALHMLGIIELQEGRPAAAEPLLRQAIECNPRVDSYHINFGNCLRNLGKADEALSHLKRALSLSPKNPTALSSLGIAYAEQGRYTDAIPLLRKAVKFEPGNATQKINLAKALSGSHDSEGALEMANKAVRQGPKFPEAYNERGLVHQALGDMVAAEQDFLTAITLRPAYAQAYYNLSTCRRCTDADQPLIQRFEDALKTAGLSSSEYSNIHFGLGKMYDDLGRWKEAFRHYELANQKRQVSFDRQGFSNYVDRIIRCFDKSFFESLQDGEPNQGKPIFVFGMPRSGTTLVEQVLSSGDQATGVGEKQYIPDITRKMATDLGVSADYPACIGKLTHDDIKHYGDAYLELVSKTTGKGVRSIDKMTSNFLHLGLISVLFPRAKLVHCSRDPLDTGLSCFFQNFAGHVDFSYSLRDIAFYLGEYHRIMAHWKDVLPLPIFDMSYEELIEDQEQRTRDLVQFCELDWDDSFLAPESSSRAVYTASNWQVRQAVYSRSVGRWKNYAPHMQSFIRAVNGPADQGTEPVQKSSRLQSMINTFLRK